ncbi:uncharacterized protein METZ01_LOCUS263077, partial [marine metagenome]
MPLNLNHFLKEFEIIVGTNNCISDQSKIKVYLEDWRGQIRGSTPLMLFPEALDEVQKIVSLCFLNDIKIVSQGGNTSLCGANVPQSSEHQIEIILNTSKLNKFLSIDPYNQSIIVESGCVLQNIQEIAD